MRTVLFTVLMVASAALSFIYVPKSQLTKKGPSFAALVPERFGNWHTIPGIQLVTVEEPDALEKELYSQVVGRAYADDHGHVVMLLLAYGPTQTDRLQLHRPEICYVANGFHVSDISQGTISIGPNEAIPVKRLRATRGDRSEAITYWMRIGDQVANSVWRRQLITLEFGLKGLIPDGLLVRTSVLGIEGLDATRIQDQFVRQLVDSSPVDLRMQLTGSDAPGPTLSQLQ